MHSTIRKRGNASGVVVPRYMLAEAGIAAGDAIASRWRVIV